MKNITFFIQNFSRSAGSERVTSIIANALSNKYNITILSICGDNSSFYKINKNIKLITLIDKNEINNKKYFFKVLQALKKYYSKNKVDLVIDVFASLSIYTLLLKKKYKYKSITWEHFNFNANVGLNKLGRRMSAKKAEYIVTLTEKDKMYYLEALPKMKSKITSIYNPTPYKDVEVDNGLRENIVLSVGRLTYQKGFDILLKTWSNIEKSMNDWKLLIVGSGEEYDNLIQIIKEYGLKNVEFIAATNKIDEIYKKAKIYVSTARFEGLPMTMIEAQSFGLPIISFDYDTGPSDIVKSGEDGYLIENGNTEELNKALIGLMDNEKQITVFSDKAKISSKRFENSEIEKKWFNLIEELL